MCVRFAFHMNAVGRRAEEVESERVKLERVCNVERKRRSLNELNLCFIFA